MPIRVRFDEKTELLLQRLAHRRSRTKSEIIREAIQCLAREELRAEDSTSPFELISDLVGSVHGGRPDLSVGAGRRLRELLASREESR